MARSAVPVAVVAATDRAPTVKHQRRLAGLVAVPVIAVGIVAGLTAPAADAAVLPDDRVDLLYHRYDGDDVTIDGPSVLVRKKLGENFSVSGNYYVDMVSSASIDVRATASPYTEERTQSSLGVSYLSGKTIMSLGYTRSDENDFEANSIAFGISQDMFGDLTTISLSYGLGWDTVMQRGDDDFSEPVDRQSYGLGLTQILTRKLLVSVNYETITDEGFLNNPYRSYRHLSSPTTFEFKREIYPRTRTSNATSIRARYYLPYRAALHGSYRYYTDTWGIDAHTGEIGYTHPWNDDWILSATLRYYTQGDADFYADLFPRENAQNFMARDKEMSSFSNYTIGLGIVREYDALNWGMFEKGSVNLFWDFQRYEYDNFRDATVTGTLPGQEPLFEFDANVVRLFVSMWF